MAKSNDGAKPWERQLRDGKWESTQSFRAFSIYRDLGPDRSLQEAYRIFTVSKSDSVGGTFRGWCSDWSWVQRCRLWDDEQDRVSRAKTLEEIERMKRRHAAESQLSAMPATAGIRELLRRIQEDPKALAALSVKDLMWLGQQAPKALETAHRSERAARLGGDGKFAEVEIEAEEAPVSGNVEWESDASD